MKLLFGLLLSGIVLANAEIINFEKKYLQGIALGYAQDIGMKNIGFSRESFLSLCLEELETDERIRNRESEAIIIVVNECTSQLNKMVYISI